MANPFREINLNITLSRPAFQLEFSHTLPLQGVTAIFGSSGSGKTSLLRCIAGLEKASQGEIYFRDECWQKEDFFLAPHKRSIGYVFQQANLFPHLNVEDNLQYAAKRATERSNPSAKEITSFKQAINTLNIGGLMERFPYELSGGEKQRVAIARALFVNPKLLLMDEPLASLDNAHKQEILPYLCEIRRQLNLPIVYVSHSVDEVARLADHLVVLEQGKIVTSGPLKETLAQLDFPLNLADDFGVVVDAKVTGHDEQWKLAKLSFNGGELWFNESSLNFLFDKLSTGIAGKLVRLRILAKDVSLALSHHKDSSILNILPGQVRQIVADPVKGLALVGVDVGATTIIARITQRSASHLNLQPGKIVWLQIKSAALIG